MNRLLGIAFGAIVMMMTAANLLDKVEPEPGQVPLAKESAPATAVNEVSEAAMVLKRDSSGQFHIGGDVNGTSTRFLVDTGADILALTAGSAEAAGIMVEDTAYQPIMQTASGTGYGAPVTIDALKLGESEFRNVEAVVVRDLPVNLLGQNVLRKLGRVTLQGDRMLIQPR